jgi:excisionase family DNA binding protein
MVSLDGMITVAEAAKRLGRSLEQVRRYLREGKLRGQRIGGQWFVEEASLPLRYQPSRGTTQPIREVGVVMEAGKLTKEEIDALIKRIDENREAIRRRLGRGLDLTEMVEMIRRDREER